MKLYSIQQIAEATGKTVAGIAKRVDKGRKNRKGKQVEAPWVPDGKKGKAVLFDFAKLPKSIQDDIARHELKTSASSSASAAPEPQVPVKKEKSTAVAIRAPITTEMADAQQLVCQQARLCILTAIRKSVAVGLHKTESIAFDAWLELLAKDELTPQQTLWCALANNRNGFRYEVSFASGHPVAIALDGQDIEKFAAKLTKRTAQNWMQLWKDGGDDALLPKVRQKDMSVPAWAGAFLAEMQRPQKPAVQTAFDAMAKKLQAEGWTPHTGKGLPKAMEYPDYGSVCRWYREKFSKLDKRKGRNTGSAMNPFKFHHERSAEGMEPLQEVHSDGWATKFYAPHPISGKWVTGEVWHSHDVATRKAYVHARSIGLSENTPVILGSLYAVCVEDGEPLFWQTDNTGAVKNDRVEFDPVASIAARRSIEIVHNTPGNSQANGIAESFNRYLQERSKELATYKGKDQDSRTQIRIHKITNKLTKAANASDASEFARLRAQAEKEGCGIVFSAWADVVEWVKRVVTEFNDMPHRSLPKVTDSTGKRRHMTPNERMAEFIAAGWQRRPLSGEELIDAFRVHEVKRVTRGCVSIMGQRYHHAELDHHNGEDVLVAYDIEDGSQVYIKNLEGVFMYVAAFYESRSYRMQSFVDIVANKRVDGQLKRLDIKEMAIEAQRPGVEIEMSLAPAIESSAVRLEEPLQAEVLAIPSAEAEQARRRQIANLEDSALIRHLAQNPIDWNDNLRLYLAEQSEKIKNVAWLIDEHDLWRELENVSAKGFERRVS